MFVMTTTHHSEINFWEPCKAKTLLGAKREAHNRYNEGNVHNTLWIGYTSDGDIQLLSRKSNMPNSKWTNME